MKQSKRDGLTYGDAREILRSYRLFLSSIGWTFRENGRPVCPEHSEPILDQISRKVKVPCLSS